MNEEIYRKLADHLETLPGGFAQSETGAELRLLQRLFTEEEAEIGVHLTLDREEAEVIAGRAGIPDGDAEELLRGMSHKGLIFSVQPETGPALFQAIPWVVGIYEFQVNRMDEGLLASLADYYGTQKPRQRPRTIPQMRTIPVGESIESHMQILPHEHIGKLIEDRDRYAVAPCICRKHHKMAGAGCDALEEACLMFDEFADYYVRDGRGRSIDRAEVMEILAKADAANLVLQPTNSKEISAICCCCGCCCGLMRTLQSAPKPSEVVANAFIARLDAETCEGCLTCLDRCQMGAFTENDDGVDLSADRCIGCGLCVSTCPSDALALVRKPDTGVTRDVPDTIDETWRIISRTQAEGR